MLWPIKSELESIEAKYSELGFPGWAGAMDCMHLFSKNNPFQNEDQMLSSKNSTKLASIQCQPGCDHDLYC